LGKWEEREGEDGERKEGQKGSEEREKKDFGKRPTVLQKLNIRHSKKQNAKFINRHQ
jgi:hypothetical protein